MKNFAKSWGSNYKKSFSEQQIFFSNLSIILSSGIPLVQALKITQSYINSKKSKNIISKIIYEINNGSRFSEAISRHKKIFSSITVQIIKSGEESGNLQAALENLANYLKKRDVFIKKLKQAALAPSLTLFLSIMIVSALLIFVVPQLEPIFSSIEGNLPKNTKTILGVSNFLKSEQNRFLLTLLILLSFIFLKVIKSFHRTKEIFDRVFIKIPFLKNIVIKSNLAQFTQTLSFLLKSGNQLKPSILLSSKVCTNKIIEKELFSIAEKIEKGESLFEAFGSIKSNLLPQSFLESISIGQETGKLEIMLEKTAKLLEEKIDSQINFICSIFQPILIIALGAFIAFLILSIYLPLFNLANISF